ncbi:hypothetical protein MJO52_18795 [Microbulbifer variabilis]|uniref:DUF304 domain-containing protein n=1 Tax=Microbulbifer variabilis TaxID=266805 RepID=A0ABY4V9X7_9GAMM|nr:hypothetical protein [Microbulbifer variabilis]USD21086.1 hypothetical protein MJO52_18795 [Microbulbifer variabilis]
MNLSKKCIITDGTVTIKRNSYCVIFIVLAGLSLLTLYIANITLDLGPEWVVLCVSPILLSTLIGLRGQLFPVQTKIDFNREIVFMRELIQWKWKPMCRLKWGLKDLYISSYIMNTKHTPAAKFNTLCLKAGLREYMLFESMDDSAIRMKDYIYENSLNKKRRK